MTTSAARQARRQRLDTALVQRGLARSRQAAQALVMSGRVSVDGRVVDKSGHLVAADAGISVTPGPREYASRGGHKLAGALDAFGLDPRGKDALDVGSSTGGFTDCLLRRGARRVVCVDVGRGQLDWTLRNDARVVSLEGVNVRELAPESFPAEPRRFDMIVVDVSFISLRLALPPLIPLLREGGILLALVKPQFEVGKGRVGKGGIVREPRLRAETLAGIAGFAASIGLSVRGMAASALKGAEGNQEFFIHVDRGTGGMTDEEIERRADEIAGSQG